MKQAAETTTTKTPSGASLTAGIIGMSFLDTTWRMAVPVLLAAAIGIVADRTFGTKPWLTLSSLIPGFIVAIWLVKRQLDAVERKERS